MSAAMFDEWTSNIESIDGVVDDLEQISHNQAYLRYLHFAHTCITGGRMYTASKNKENGFPEDASIIAGCLQEAYELADHGAGEDNLDSWCYGFEM